MPLPVVSDVYQARLVWTSAGAPRPASNNLYFKDQAGGHTGTAVYNAIDTAWARNLIKIMSNTAGIDKIVTTKLDGTAAAVDHATGRGVKWTGTGGTDFILQGACVVTFKTGFRGRSRRGRIFLPWVSEDEQNDGTLASVDVADMQTAWGTFLNDMIAAGYPLHVVSPLHSDSVQAASVIVRPYLKTQRRRSRR